MGMDMEAEEVKLSGVDGICRARSGDVVENEVKPYTATIFKSFHFPNVSPRSYQYRHTCSTINVTCSTTSLHTPSRLFPAPNPKFCTSAVAYSRQSAGAISGTITVLPSAPFVLSHVS